MLQIREKRFIRKLVFCSALFTAVFFGAFAQKVTPVQKYGKLRVEGAKILDATNHVAQLRGVSMSWSVWGGRKYYNPYVVKWLVADFNITLLRIAMAVQPDSGYLQDPVGQEKMITNTIDAAIKEGIYVLLDWHDHNSNKHIPQSKAFFSKMSKKYAGVPNIIYEIWNEPEEVEWSTIKNYALQIIPEIRKNNPESIIVIGSSKWDQDVDITAKDPIVGFKNIAYSFHFYASDPYHQDALMQKADDAIAKGLPLFVTEWGVGEASGDGMFDLAKTEKWFAWLEKNKLCWANWNVTDKKETTALLQPRASPYGKWGKSFLTPAGIFIRTKLKDLNGN